MDPNSMTVDSILRTRLSEHTSDLFENRWQVNLRDGSYITATYSLGSFIAFRFIQPDNNISAQASSFKISPRGIPIDKYFPGSIITEKEFIDCLEDTGFLITDTVKQETYQAENNFNSSSFNKN